MTQQGGAGGGHRLRTALQLAVCVAGIYGAYLTQGVVQETLSTKKFGPAGERFKHLSALNAVQSWACFLWAFLLLRFFERDKRAGYPPFTAYWKAAVTNCIGPACGERGRRGAVSAAAPLPPKLLEPAHASRPAQATRRSSTSATPPRCWPSRPR